VTRAEGRELVEIDGRPADEVYEEWTGGALGALARRNLSILPVTTLHPLGRIAGRTGEVETFLLSHPATAREDGALTLFSDVVEGEELVLMSGTHEGLIQRAGRVARAARSRVGADLAGALVVICAGCMLAIRDRMPEVTEQLRIAFGGRPFVGFFSFGEQGCFPWGESFHGNLMFSVLAWQRSNATE
jgi:hypothetical protein